MRHGVMKLLMCVVCLIPLPQTVSAAEEAEEATAGVIFTPRIWFGFVDNVNESNTSDGQIYMPLYGGTITVIPSFAPNLNFLLTGLHGTADGSFLNQTPRSFGTLDMERTDIELLMRYNFPGTKVYALFGPRYVTVDTDKTSPGFKSQNHAYLLVFEAGLGMVADITDDSLNRLFGNIVFILANNSFDYEDSDGLRLSDTNVDFGFDFNMGYQYWITSYANISVRYRGFFLTQNNDFNQTEVFAIHGPEASVGFVF